MRIFSILLVSFSFVHAEKFIINTFETMVSAGKKSLINNQDNLWIFQENHQLLNIKNPNLQKELKKYYDYMNSQKTPISSFKIPSTSMCKTIGHL